MKQKITAIISLIALTFIMALTSCAPISDGASVDSSQITIRLPPIGSSAIRALTEEQVSRLQRDTKKYRVTFNGVGQTITREGEGTTYSATFPVGVQVGVTVYCLNAKGEIIVRTVTKNITISSGANSLSFKLSDDGTEIIHESGGDTPGGDVPGGDTGGGSGDDEKPDDTDKEPDDDDSGGDDNPPAPPPPVTEYVNITFNQGFVYTNTVHQSPNTWQAMTGATLPNSGQREKGSTVSADQATAAGYVFKGWVENSQSPSGVAPDVQSFNYVQNYDSDMTLYAIWEQIEPGSHSVKFAGGTTTGSSASGLPQGFQQKENTQATFSGTPTCPGYEFAGWNADVAGVTVTQQGNGWEFTMPTSDVTLTAQWNVITYTLSYEANDGQATSPQTETFTVDAGGANVTLKVANTFTRTGYTFSQWNAGNNNWSPSTDISKTSLIALAVQGSDATHYNITLTAQWTVNKYKVKYEPNAPSGATVMYNGATATTQEVERTYGQSFSWASNMFTAPNGYSFASWNTQENGNGTTLTGTATSDYINRTDEITVYAKWTEKDYTVTYSGGAGSTGSQAGQTISVASKGDELPIKDTTTLSKTGYTLAGWEYNNARYDDLAALRAAISDGTITVTSITLTAVWTPTTYAITWNDVGNLTGQKDMYTIEDNYTLPTPTKNDYTFVGWYTEAAFTNKVTEISRGSTGAKQFYAKWMWTANINGQTNRTTNLTLAGSATDVNIEFVGVTGGTAFTMGDGSNSDNAAWSGVTVSSFYMGKYEVTQAQWEAVMGNKGNGTLPSATYGVGDNFPQYYVSWYDALVFCNKLSLLENKTPCYKINNDTNPDNWGTVPTSTNATWDAVVCDWTSDGYRLPTEAELEYAARGGAGQTHNKYSGIDSATTPNPTEDDLKTVAWYSGNEGSKSHEVGTTPVKENALGISDMSGNVWEWCWDWYNSGGYEKAHGAGNTRDPRAGAASGSNRVKRGGSWYNGASICPVSYRSDDSPDNRNLYNGLRVVCGQP